MIYLISGSKKTNLLFMPASLVSVDQSKLDPTPQHQSEYPSPAVHPDQPPTFQTVTESDQPTDYQHNQPTSYPPGTQPGPHPDYPPSYHPPAVSQPSALMENPGTLNPEHQNRPPHSQDPTIHGGYPPVTEPIDLPPPIWVPPEEKANPVHSNIPSHPFHHPPPSQPPATFPPASLSVGSAVQLVQDPSRTGVIRWTGYLPGAPLLIAGVELVSSTM